MRDHRDERPRQRDAQHRSGAAEHEAFGEQRAAERAAAGAERRAHGELPFAADGTREDQVGDVRARDHEHDSGCGEQHEQDRPRGRRNLIAQPGHVQLDADSRRVRFRVLAHDRGVHG